MRSIIRKLTSAGVAAGTTMLLTGALFAGPAHAAPVEPKLAFQEDVLCNSSFMVYGVDVTNEGDPVSIRVTKFTQGSIVASDLILANGETSTVSLDTSHYKIVRLVMKVDDVTVYDTGQITSTGSGSGECNFPVPAVRSDISFDVTASCGDAAALYTLTASSAGPGEQVKLSWVGGNGVPSYYDIWVNGQASHSLNFNIDEVVRLYAVDAWGRSLYTSPELVADSDGCPRTAQHDLTPKMGVECVDGSPVLYAHVFNFGDFREFFYFEYQVGHEDEEVGGSNFDSLEVGESFEFQTPFAAGKAILATVSSNSDSAPFFEFALTAEETACGTPVDDEEPTDTTVPGGDGGSTDETTPTTAPDTGSKPPASTDPQAPTAPVTPEAPRSLPSTGRTSTSLIIIAAAVLLSGLSMRVLGRRAD
jgi:LPXTG-motif cell wall-anchored protein